MTGRSTQVEVFKTHLEYQEYMLAARERLQVVVDIASKQDCEQIDKFDRFESGAELNHAIALSENMFERGEQGTNIGHWVYFLNDPDYDITAHQPDTFFEPSVFTDVWFIINYPLDNPAKVTMRKRDKDGFSLHDIYLGVCLAYREIYNMEESYIPQKVDNFQKLGSGIVLMNRPSTNGPFEIWGHGINDLYLEGLQIYISRDNPDTCFIDLDMGS